jgi:flagellar protein FlgJ
MYEEHFMREMVRAMRSTVPESELLPASMGEKIFKDQLDDKYVNEWTARGGVGLADMIYENVMEKYMGQRGYQRPKGPMPLDKKHEFQLNVEKSEGPSTQMRIRGQLHQDDSALQMTAPWGGKVSLQNDPSSSLKAYFIEHDNDLKSVLAFQGTSLIKDGDEVQAGQPLAILDPNLNEIYWKLSAKPKS